MIVIALDQTIASLRERGEPEWQEHVETLSRLRDDTIARVHQIYPSVKFDAPAAE